jgi:hypothetical protein
MHGVLNRLKSSRQPFGCKFVDDVKHVICDVLFLPKKFKRKPLVEPKSIALNESGAFWKLVVNELHRHVGPMKDVFAVFVSKEVGV